MRSIISIFMTAVFVLSYVALGGIIIDFFTMIKAKKYVKLMGNYSFQNVRQFFIFSMVFFGISWLCFGTFLFSGIYSFVASQPVLETLPILRGSYRVMVRAVFCHILCIAAGLVTINGYKTAKKCRAKYELPERANYLPKSVICGNCGKINKSVNKFCVCCGKNLSEEK